MSITRYNNKGTTSYSGFPYPFAPREEKNKLSYGLQVFRAIIDGTAEYRKKRLSQIKDSNMFAEGKQPLEPYLKEMNFSEGSLYTNIPFDPSPIASKFEKNVVDGYKLKREKPEATADGKHIKDRKEKRRLNMQYRMNYEPFIQQLSQEAGFNLEDPNVEVPKDKEGLDLYMSLNDKEREELMMQDMINLVLKDNDQDAKKRAFLSDMFRHSFGGYFNYIDHRGRLVYDIIRPENAIYSVSHNEFFNDLQYAGHEQLTHISDIRSRFNMTPDDEMRLYKLARKYSGKYTNYSRIGEWEAKFRDCDSRPYDNYVVPLYHVWIKTSKTIGYLEGKDRNGRDIFDIKNERPYQKESVRKKSGEKIIATSYEGWFAGNDATVVLDWGESKNILREGLDKEDVLCPYIFFMPDNRGSMLTPSAIQMIKPYIKSIDIARIKLKHTIANAAPAGYAIDIDALLELDLKGDGSSTQPLELADIYRQTGTLYYRGKTEDGGQGRIPVNPMNPDISGAINAFVQVYNMELAQIRDTLGVNEFRDGSANNPRTGFRFAQAQLEASNTATTYIYDAYIKCTEELTKQIGMRTWDNLLYGNPNKGYLKYLGQENIDFLKEREDITSSNYDYSFKMVLSGEELQRLETYLNTCLANGTLQMDDALMVMRVEDPLLAEKTLAYVLNRRERLRNEAADERSRAAAEANAQAGAAVEEEKRKTAELESQVTLAKTNATTDGELKVSAVKGVFETINNYAKLGQEPPEYIMSIFNTLMQETVLKSEKDTMEAEQVLQQEQQAMAQQQIIEQIQQQVQSGNITEEEGVEVLQQQGLM